MSKRKKIITGTLILTLAIVARDWCHHSLRTEGSWPEDFLPAFTAWMSPRTARRGHADFILWKMDRHVKELNLSDDQKKDYEKSKEEIRAGIAEAIERKKDFHRIVHEEMDKENRTSTRWPVS